MLEKMPTISMEEVPDGNPVSKVPLSSGGQVPVTSFVSLPCLNVLDKENKSSAGPYPSNFLDFSVLASDTLLGQGGEEKEEPNFEISTPQNFFSEAHLRTPSPKNPDRNYSYGGRGKGRGRGRGATGRSRSTISPTDVSEHKTPDHRAQSPPPLRGENFAHESFSLDNLDSRKELNFDRDASVNLENPSSKLLCGYVVIVQTTPFGTTLLWSGGNFFRVRSDSFEKFPKPLTPVLFRSEFISHRRGTGVAQEVKTFCAEFVELCSDKEGNPPSVKGFFSFQDDKKFVFNWNPEGAFPSFIKCTVYRDTLPRLFRDSLRLNSPCAVIFSSGRPSRNQAGAALPVVTDISSFGLPLPPGPPVSEPVNGAFPPEVLQDLKELAQFNIHIVVGLPDNSIIPSLSYSDFILLKNCGTFSWTTVEAKVGEKYAKLKNSVNKLEAERAELFLTKLGQHRGNKGGGGKNILVLPGLWPELTQTCATSFADTVLKVSAFGAFVALPAHPLSTAENVHELNPHVCGNFSHQTVEACFFSDTPVATGEFNPFTEEMDFTLARNAKKYLFLQMKKLEAEGKFPVDGASMFTRPVPFAFRNYLGLPHKKTGSEITSDQFVLFSVESSLRKTLNCFPRSGTPCKILPDPSSICTNFAQAQIYSAEENLSRENAFKIYASAADNSEAPLVGSAFCSSFTVINPCAPENDVRTIKISNLASVKGNENKTAVLVLFEQLGLAVETFPLSRFYYKIRRGPLTSDQALIDTLTSFNRSMPCDGPLFHSVYDGSTTRSLVYKRPLPPPPPPVPKKRAHPCALLVIDPPFSLSLSKVAEWSRRLPFPRKPCWGLTPTLQNCIVVEFFPDETGSFQALSSQEFDGASYAVRFFLNLPRNYSVYSDSAPPNTRAPLPLSERGLPPLPKHFVSIVEKLLPKPPSEKKGEGGEGSSIPPSQPGPTGDFVCPQQTPSLSSVTGGGETEIFLQPSLSGLVATSCAERAGEGLGVDEKDDNASNSVTGEGGLVLSQQIGKGEGRSEICPSLAQPSPAVTAKGSDPPTTSSSSVSGGEGCGGNQTGSIPSQPSSAKNVVISKNIPPVNQGKGGEGARGGVFPLFSPSAGSQQSKAARKSPPSASSSFNPPPPKHQNSILFKGVTHRPLDSFSLPGVIKVPPRTVRPPPEGLGAEGPSKDLSVALAPGSPLKRTRAPEESALVQAKKPPPTSLVTTCTPDSGNHN